MHKKQLKNPYYTRGERKERKWRHAEKNFMLFMFKIRRKKLTSFMKMMTWIGDGWIWTVICILFLPIQVHTGIALCAASLIEVGLQQILKHIFTRQRPYIKHDDITNLMLPPDEILLPVGAYRCCLHNVFRDAVFLSDSGDSVRSTCRTYSDFTNVSGSALSFGCTCRYCAWVYQRVVRNTPGIVFRDLALMDETESACELGNFVLDGNGFDINETDAGFQSVCARKHRIPF